MSHAIDLQNPGTAVLRVALLEDEDRDALLFTRLLEQAWPGRLEMTHYETVAELESHLSPAVADLVFSDLSLPDGSGVGVVERVLRVARDAPVIVMTGNGDPQAPVEALQAGAEDYLRKWDFDPESLFRSLRYSIARHDAAIEMRRIARDLTLLNQELDQIAGIMAHDLRAPIRTARLFADRLVSAVTSGGDIQTLSGALFSSLERMEALVSRLMELASVSDDALRPIHQPLSVIVDNVAESLDADLRSSQSTLTSITDGKVFADDVLIRQLLQNVVQNSIRYASPDRAPIIEVFFRLEAEFTVIQVSDNGIGVEPKYRERIFDLLARLDQDDDRQGLGFGLSFCRKITDMHGGSIIAVDPPTGIGATLEIRLPRSDAAPSPKSIESSKGTSKAVSPAP